MRLYEENGDTTLPKPCLKSLQTKKNNTADFSFLEFESFLEKSLIDDMITNQYKDQEITHHLSAEEDERKELLGFLKHIRPFTLDMIGIEEGLSKFHHSEERDDWNDDNTQENPSMQIDMKTEPATG